MSLETNDQPNKARANIPKAISDKEGCLRATYAGCGLLLILIIVVGAIVYLRLDNFFLYGINNNLNKLQKKINTERTLTDAQYYEMNQYLNSLGAYLVKEGRSKEAIVNFRMVYKAFQDGLKDDVLERDELAAIRSAMLESTIPIIELKEEKTIPDIDQ